MRPRAAWSRCHTTRASAGGGHARHPAVALPVVERDRRTIDEDRWTRRAIGLRNHRRASRATSMMPSARGRCRSARPAPRRRIAPAGDVGPKPPKHSGAVADSVRLDQASGPAHRVALFDGVHVARPSLGCSHREETSTGANVDDHIARADCGAEGLDEARGTPPIVEHHAVEVHGLDVEKARARPGGMGLGSGGGQAAILMPAFLQLAGLASRHNWRTSSRPVGVRRDSSRVRRCGSCPSVTDISYVNRSASVGSGVLSA
jgi:hypothetical protein